MSEASAVQDEPGNRCAPPPRESTAMPEVSDEMLILRVGKGEEAAFALLVERHLPRAVGMAMRYLKTREAAEDAAQEAFTKLWLNAPKWKKPEDMPGKGSFSSWFYRILANHCVDRLRKKRPQPMDDNTPEPQDEDKSAEEKSYDRQLALHVRKTMAMLPENQRLALNLCFFEGYSNAEAAEMLDSTVKGIESLLVRARRTLRDELEEFWVTIKEDM